jgi:hypothetical protein
MQSRPRSILLRRILACHVQRGSDRRDDIPIASLIAARAGRSPIADTMRVRLPQPMR